MPYKDKNIQREKNKEYQRKHYQKKKQYYIDKAKNRHLYLKNYVERVKRLSKCKCGESRHWVLDFHHKQGKDFAIGNSSKHGYSISKIKNEMRKCDILCANCHRDLHYKEKHCG